MDRMRLIKPSSTPMKKNRTSPQTRTIAGPCRAGGPTVIEPWESGSLHGGSRPGELELASFGMVGLPPPASKTVMHTASYTTPQAAQHFPLPANTVLEIATYDQAGVTNGTVIYFVRGVSILDDTGHYIEAMSAGGSNPGLAIGLSELWPDHQQPTGCVHLCSTQASQCGGPLAGRVLVRLDIGRRRVPTHGVEPWGR